LFLDEIHRFNKAQQDFLLPFVEDGTIRLIGATTENPSFEVIAPLLSRSTLVVLEPLAKSDIITILKKAKPYYRGRKVNKVALDVIAEMSGGDARHALNTLDLALQLTTTTVDERVVEQAMQRSLQRYDKGGEEHYSVISAFIKSLRASDADAAMYYLQRMLTGGEDPRFIARRMIIFASEDIGMASPHVLTFAVSVFNAVEKIGMPEANYILSHATVALATAKKSRAVADAMQRASQAVDAQPNLPVPLHLRNAATSLMKDLGYGKDYEWVSGYVHPEGYLPPELKRKKFYII
jgi:putative ATPase